MFPTLPSNSTLITQTQKGETIPLIYNLFILLLAKQYYNIYKHEPATIIKFIKKYSYILNVVHQLVIYTDHKPLVGFLNAKYYKNIFADWTNKLCLLNICIQYILKKKNTIENGLS